MDFISVEHPGLIQEYEKMISVIKEVVPESESSSDDEEIMEFSPE